METSVTVLEEQFSLRSIGDFDKQLLLDSIEGSSLPWTNVFRENRSSQLAQFYFDQWESRGVEVVYSSATHSGFAYEHLDWDSGLLGINCGRVFPLGDCGLVDSKWVENEERLIREMVKMMRSRGVQLADIKVSTNDLILMRALESSGFHTVDILLTLGANRSKLQANLDAASKTISMQTTDSTEFANGLTVRPIRESEIPQMEQLAREAFSDTTAIKDRFYLEPTIPHERANALFLEWFRNSIRKQHEARGVVLVAARGKECLGFLTMDKPMHPALAGYWQDSLNAVSPAARGQGVYRSLVIAAMYLVVRNGGEGLITRTQVSTNRVINTWLHLGADLLESFCTLHWTP